MFADGRRLTRARTPNEGYLRTASPLRPLGDRRKARRDASTKMGFMFNAGDIQRWPDLADVNLFRVSVVDQRRAVDRQPGRGQTVGTVHRAHVLAGGLLERRQRYYIAGHRPAWMRPASGTWTGARAWSPTGRPEGEDPQRMAIVAPVSNEIVRLDGQPDKGRFVEHIHFQGLAFQHAAWDLPRDKMADGQPLAFSCQQGYRSPVHGLRFPAADVSDDSTVFGASVVWGIE